MPTVAELQQRVHERRDEIIEFLRDICAIPSMESQIGPVGERIQAEMRRLGWDFSTNGTSWAGKAGIPAIGLGPGDEKTAHMMHENVPLDEVVRAAEWYAWLPHALAGGER
jgi:acetylornithine deacetylase/succinyl-diaminopimelate desuccinylase-like protein